MLESPNELAAACGLLPETAVLHEQLLACFSWEVQLPHAA